MKKNMPKYQEYRMCFFITKIQLSLSTLNNIKKVFKKSIGQNDFYLHFGINHDSEKEMVFLNLQGIKIDTSQLKKNELELNKVIVRHFWCREASD